jgi:hypothetical protein
VIIIHEEKDGIQVQPVKPTTIRIAKMKKTDAERIGFMKIPLRAVSLQ